MLILDKSRALDRMIWASGRHAVVVPDEFSSAAVPIASPPIDDAPWRWTNAPAVHHTGRRRLASVVELRRAA